MPTLEEILNGVSSTCDPALAYIPFGKHRDRSLLDVAADNPGYLDWMLQAYEERFFSSDRINTWIEDHRDLFADAKAQAGKALVEQADVVELTPHQHEVTDELLALIRNGEPVVRLEGGAGYGKSFATDRLVRELKMEGREVRACAVSYVATEVLRKQLDHLGVECGTIARTLRFEKVWNGDQALYQFSDETPMLAIKCLQPRQVLIVDECSMVNDDVADLLLKTARHHGGTLILVGDSAQLPPVKQPTVSRCCTDVPPDAVACLTKPMRYAEDSPLFTVEQLARYDPFLLFAQLNTEQLTAANCVEVTRSIDDLYQRFADHYRADPDALHRMMLFRRTEVTKANAAIRRKLFGENAPDIADDERLMILATTDFPWAVTEEDKQQCVRYYSSQHFRVDSVETDTYKICINGEDFEIPHYVITFVERVKPIRVLFGVSETKMEAGKLGSAQFEEALHAARKQGLKEDANGNRIGDWSSFRQLKADFVPVSYLYATSVHRAQGQTTDYAYTVPTPLLGVPGIMGRALHYVAMTRARRHLTVAL